MRRSTLGGNIGRRGGLALAHRVTGERLPLADQQFDEPVNLTIANELEAYPLMAWGWRRGCRAYLRRFRQAAMPSARRALNALRPRWWEFWK